MSQESSKTFKIFIFQKTHFASVIKIKIIWCLSNSLNPL